MDLVYDKSDWSKSSNAVMSGVVRTRQTEEPLTVAYVARNDGTDMRVSKECNSLVDAGHVVHFIGWVLPETADSTDPMPRVEKHLLAANKNGMVATVVGLIRFASHVAVAVHRLRPDVVHYVNEELGAFILPLQKLYHFKAVCDIFDSIELKWGQSKFPTNLLAHRLATFSHRNSDVLFVTDETRRARLGLYARKAVTVPNYPVDVGADVAFNLPPETGPIRLYVAGTLYSARGLDSILRLLDEREDLTVISAGWLYDDVARRFVEHRSVEYLGVVPPADSLKLAASCHAILALYEPSNENNILASPNKIYDALCVGRPVIINREVNVATWVSENSVGHVVPYGSVPALAEVVDALIQTRHGFLQTAAALRALYENGFSWSVAERELLAAYSDIRCPSSGTQKSGAYR